MMPTRKKICLFVFGLCCIFVYVFWPLNPARRPDAEIRNEMLRLTPIGSDRKDVEAALQSRFGANIENWQGKANDGAGMLLTVLYGRYYAFESLPLETFVRVTYRFDGHDKLISVGVLKYCLGP